MKASTKAVVFLTALSLGFGQISGQTKNSVRAKITPSHRSIITFGQPISEKKTIMPIVEISEQQRKWVVDAFAQQLKSIREQAGVNGEMQMNSALIEGAQKFADTTLAYASDTQWEQWGHTLGGPMAMHMGEYSKRAGCSVLAECLTRGYYNTNPAEFDESEWREIGIRAAWSMKLSPAHYAAMLTNAKENKIGMGFSMHEQKIGNGANPPTQLVSDFVFWIGCAPRDRSAARARPDNP